MKGSQALAGLLRRQARARRLRQVTSGSFVVLGVQILATLSPPRRRGRGAGTKTTETHSVYGQGPAVERVGAASPGVGMEEEEKAEVEVRKKNKNPTQYSRVLAKRTPLEVTRLLALRNQSLW